MKREEISAQLKAYIAQQVLDGKQVGLDEQTPLIEWGILNSIEIMRLLSFIRDTFKVNVSPTELLATNFSTIDSITRLVLGSMAGSQ